MNQPKLQKIISIIVLHGIIASKNHLTYLHALGKVLKNLKGIIKPKFN